MRKLSWMLLMLLVFWAGCQDPPKVQEPPAQLEVVVGSADELTGIELVVVKGGQSIKPKPIIWKQRWSQDEVYSCRHIDASFSYGSHWSNSGAIQEVFARKRILR